jgi:hypothetical protein
MKVAKGGTKPPFALPGTQACGKTRITKQSLFCILEKKMDSRVYFKALLALVAGVLLQTSVQAEGTPPVLLVTRRESTRSKCPMAMTGSVRLLRSTRKIRQKACMPG